MCRESRRIIVVVNANKRDLQSTLSGTPVEGSRLPWFEGISTQMETALFERRQNPRLPYFEKKCDKNVNTKMSSLYAKTLDSSLTAKLPDNPPHITGLSGATFR